MRTKPRFRSLRIAALVAASLVVCLLAALYVYYPVKGLVVGTFGMPGIVQQTFIVDLRADSASQQRQKFLELWRAGSTAGLHRRVRTVEGDPLDLWAITQNGALTLVTDFTRGSFSDRVVVVEHPLAVALSQGHDIDPNPLRAWFPREDEAYLRFSLAHGSDALF